MAHKQTVDVDELLDEIEGSLKKSTISTEPKKSNKSFSQSGATTSKFVDEKASDANDLLKSLDEIETAGKNTKSPKVPTQQSSTRSHPPPPPVESEAPSLKCRMIFIAGPKELEYGHCSMIQEKACDNLHCMKCDFQVLLFKGQHWVSSVNYMFFRNFMPGKLHLSKKLSKSADHTAYCCQCSWISVSTKKQLIQNDSFQWCCNAHRS